MGEVGSKYTGLLLGTLSKEKDRNLALNMHSDNKIISERTIKEWKNYYSIQKDPSEGNFLMILKHSIEVFKLNVQFGHTCVKQT